MTNYVFTTHMKRHERAALCVKLFDELYSNMRVILIIKDMLKALNAKKKSLNKFRPKKEPLYVLEEVVFKGAKLYLFLDEKGFLDYVLNSSPVDGAYAEFIRVIKGGNIETCVYSQHALDRYNERIHSDKYTNHRDIMKRLSVNNPTNSDMVHNDFTKDMYIRIDEGFLCGSIDLGHKMIVINTFYDRAEFKDNHLQSTARSSFELMSKFTSNQLLMFQNLRTQLKEGKISAAEHHRLSVLYKLIDGKVAPE